MFARNRVDPFLVTRQQIEQVSTQARIAQECGDLIVSFAEAAAAAAVRKDDNTSTIGRDFKEPT